jgi:hypothetical protein
MNPELSVSGRRACGHPTHAKPVVGHEEIRRSLPPVAAQALTDAGRHGLIRERATLTTRAGGEKMPRHPAFRLCAALATLLGAGTAAVAGSTLKPFSSDRELEQFLEKVAEADRLPSTYSGTSADDLSEVVVTGLRGTSITNNQTEGVDEGGIVKRVGDHLVVLRRGRLFTLSLSGSGMRPVAWIAAYPPNIDADGAWYDEMLVYRDRIVVIGYSYELKATELNLFRIDVAGGLRYEATWHLRSSDYFSASNYASRLLDDKLVFYTALPASGGLASLPGIHRLPSFASLAPAKKPDIATKNGALPFERIASARHVYRPPWPVDPSRGVALHTITVCDLDDAELHCKAVSAIGSYSEVFYVSSTAAYVWTALTTSAESEAAETETNAFVYRLPLDGSAPSALPAAGMPLDQFSFLEDGKFLNVMVAARGAGNWMWRRANPEDSFALLRVPLASFGDGRQRFDAGKYRELPFAAPTDATPHNRFVGRHLLYGAGDSWREAHGAKAPLFVTRIDGTDTQAVPLAHSVDRIEVLGDDAVVMGTDDDDSLHFSGIRLDASPHSAQRHMMKNVEQGELRSHGFFYRALGKDRGVLGLPVRSAGSGGAAHLDENSSGITYLYNDGREFAPLGVLETVQDTDAEDGCIASCVDWYGNARPIFIDDRVFALLGYEIVEGEVAGKKIREIGRVSFAPFFAE